MCSYLTLKVHLISKLALFLDGMLPPETLYDIKHKKRNLSRELRARRERWCQESTEEIQLKSEKHRKFLTRPLTVSYPFSIGSSPLKKAVLTSPREEMEWGAENINNIFSYKSII